MTNTFVKRRPELLALEGWYDAGSYRFKLSCRYQDILRCSEFLDKPKHFTSCFRKDGAHWEQPSYRCQDPNWAIIYTPDKHGNFWVVLSFTMRRQMNGDSYLMFRSTIL